jgi:hypothetical protein
MLNTPCPSCGRPAVGRAFGTTDAYARCSLGHVFPVAPTAADAYEAGE